MSNEIYGNGVRVIPKESRVEFLFEVQDLAENTITGNLEPAGLKIALNLKPGTLIQPVSVYEEGAAKFEREGFPDYGITPEKVRRITWAEFQEKGYGE
jgi:hypothetical protein